MRPLAGGVLVLLAVIAGGFVAQRLFGSHSDHPLSEAREAIEGLPYRIYWGEDQTGDALVGAVRGRNQNLRFIVAKSPGEGRPKEVVPGWNVEPGGGGPFWVWDDAERGWSHRTPVEREARAKLAAELEEVICRKATGDPCPV